MKTAQKKCLRFLAACIVTLAVGGFCRLLLFALYPMPNEFAAPAGRIFFADTLPRHVAVRGVSVGQDGCVYLHAEGQTLRFNETGAYLGRYVYADADASFFLLSETGDGFRLCGYGEKQHYDPGGTYLGSERLGRFDDNEEDMYYARTASDAAGNTYRVHKFLCFSRVTGPDGGTFYRQSVFATFTYALLLFGGVGLGVGLVVAFGKGYFYITRKDCPFWLFRIRIGPAPGKKT